MYRSECDKYRAGAIQACRDAFNHPDPEKRDFARKCLKAMGATACDDPEQVRKLNAMRTSRPGKPALRGNVLEFPVVDRDR